MYTHTRAAAAAGLLLSTLRGVCRAGRRLGVIWLVVYEAGRRLGAAAALRALRRGLPAVARRPLRPGAARELAARELANYIYIYIYTYIRIHIMYIYIYIYIERERVV